MNKVSIMCCLFFLFLSFFSSQITAQTREISEQEFKKVGDLAYQKTNAENYRKKLKSQHFHNINDQVPYFQRNVTIERATNGFYEISEDKRGDKIERTETVEINNRKYLRKNNGQWKDITNPKANEFRGGFITGEVVKNKENAQRKYLGKQMLNGQTVDLYEQKITRNYENVEGLSVNEEKIWIDQNGRYLKTETKSRIGDKHIFLMTVEYEYDASIKISAPQIK